MCLNYADEDGCKSVQFTSIILYVALITLITGFLAIMIKYALKRMCNQNDHHKDEFHMLNIEHLAKVVENEDVELYKIIRQSETFSISFLEYLIHIECNMNIIHEVKDFNNLQLNQILPITI